jgi:hypothetical protein
LVISLSLVCSPLYDSSLSMPSISLLVYCFPFLGTRESLNVAEKNMKRDILVDTMEYLLPNLTRRFSPLLHLPCTYIIFNSFRDESTQITKCNTLCSCSCIDRVKRLMS